MQVVKSTRTVALLRTLRVGELGVSRTEEKVTGWRSIFPDSIVEKFDGHAWTTEHFTSLDPYFGRLSHCVSLRPASDVALEFCNGHAKPANQRMQATARRCWFCIHSFVLAVA